jgi:hypothetical protein
VTDAARVEHLEAELRRAHLLLASVLELAAGSRAWELLEAVADGLRTNLARPAWVEERERRLGDLLAETVETVRRREGFSAAWQLLADLEATLSSETILRAAA